MNDNIKFSIIVPIYKVEKFLVQCVDSLINQTYKNIEIILVDDGSPDNCPTICDEYAKKDARIKVVHKENGGVVRARIQGLLIATGEYCLCVDADDWVEKTYVEEFYSVLKDNEVDFVVCKYFLANESENIEKNYFYRFGLYNRQQIITELFPSLLQLENAKYLSPMVWAKAFKKEIFLKEQLKVDYRIKIGEDRACTIPYVYNSQSIYVLDKPLYYYRVNESSITKAKNPFSFEGLALFAEHVKNNINLFEYDFQEQYYRLIEHEFFIVAVSQFYKKDKYKNIKKEIKQKMNEEPFKDVIGKAKFKGSKKAWLMHFALKHKSFFLMWLYSKIR